jgi:hypothetical protein
VWVRCTQCPQLRIPVAGIKEEILWIFTFMLHLQTHLSLLWLA